MCLGGPYLTYRTICVGSWPSLWVYRFRNHEGGYGKVPDPLRYLRSHYPVGFIPTAEAQGCHREDRHSMPENLFDTRKE